MASKTKGGIDITICKIPEIGGQLRFASAFERRVNEEYIIPRKDISDPLVAKEALYPSSVVPQYCDEKTLTIVYKAKIVEIGSERQKNFEEVVRGFEQKVMKRHLVPRKGRIYCSESEYVVGDDSPEGLYTTLIFPRELVGRTVVLIYLNN